MLTCLSFDVSTLTCKHQTFERQGKNCQNDRSRSNFNEVWKMVLSELNEIGSMPVQSFVQNSLSISRYRLLLVSVFTGSNLWNCMLIRKSLLFSDIPSLFSIDFPSLENKQWYPLNEIQKVSIAAWNIMVQLKSYLNVYGKMK